MPVAQSSPSVRGCVEVFPSPHVRRGIGQGEGDVSSTIGACEGNGVLGGANHFSLSRRKRGSIPTGPRTSGNSDAVPTGDGFVQRSDGPPLPPGKRENDRRGNSSHAFL